MLKWRQVQAILDKLTCPDARPIPACQFTEPWLTLYQRIEPAGGNGAAERELWRAVQGLEDSIQIYTELINLLPRQPAEPQFPSLEELAHTLPPLEWLWPGWLPRGMLSLLGAAPGAGKSLVALDLARRIIHGLPLPDGAAVPYPGGNIIFVDAEAVPQVQNQRALAWNMDRSRLYLMLPPNPYGMIDFGADDCQDTLVQMAYETCPQLIIVDSLSTITGKGENNVEDVRHILAFLSSVARELDTTVLLIHHLRKRGAVLAAPEADLVTPDDFRGSSHIIAMARSVLALSLVQTGPEPDRNGPRRLEVIKTNLCRYPPALGVTFQPDHPHAPTLHYDAPPKPYTEPTQTDQCAAWLLDLLSTAGRPLKPKDIVALAKQAGYTQGVVYRARKTLGAALIDTAAKYSPGKAWLLNPDLDPQPAEPDD